MFFEYPQLLWLMIVPALLGALYLFRELTGRRTSLNVASGKQWQSGGRTPLEVLRHLPELLRLAAMCLIVVCIARPRSSSQSERVDTEGIDIMLAMDVSTSMLARDFEPDRINAAKDIAMEFIAQRPSDRMGIVVFAGESYTQCPLTTDRATLINLMKELQTGLIDDGTAIGNGLATAVARLTDSDAKSRVVILLPGDGGGDCIYLWRKGLHHWSGCQRKCTVPGDDSLGHRDAEPSGPVGRRPAPQHSLHNRRTLFPRYGQHQAGGNLC